MLIPILLLITLLIFLLVKKRGLLFIGLLILFFTNIFRNFDVGTDYSNYKERFDNIDLYTLNLFGVNNFFMNEERSSNEIVWNYINYLVNNIGGEYFHVNLIAIFLILTLFYISIKRESTHQLLSLFLFVSLYYYYQSFNTTRQSITIAIFVFSIYYMRKNEKIKYVILTLLSSTIHLSSIFLLPLCFFINKIKISYKQAVYIVGASFLVLLIPIDKLLLKIFSENLIYSNYLNQKLELNFNGLLPIYINNVMLSAFFLWSLKLSIKDNNIYTKIWFLGILIQNLSMDYRYLSRFSDYFLIAQIFAIPMIYKNICNQNNKNIYFKSLILYSILIYVLRLLTNNQGILPYSFL
jgi:transmembrane protein EpsG